MKWYKYIIINCGTSSEEKVALLQVYTGVGGSGGGSEITLSKYLISGPKNAWALGPCSLRDQHIQRPQRGNGVENGKVAGRPGRAQKGLRWSCSPAL